MFKTLQLKSYLRGLIILPLLLFALLVHGVSSFDLSILSGQFSSWGVSPYNNSSSINLVGLWESFRKKRDVVVAVIDTGIDPNHIFLKDNIHVIAGGISKVNYGVDFSSSSGATKTPLDTHGHGTHVSGIIKSIFPKVKILNLKYYNPKGSGQENLDATIRALEYAVNGNVDIINYSGGGPEPSKKELEILKRAERKGILVVAASGNEESNLDVKGKSYYPASYGLSNIITVTAHDQGLRILSSSNYGKNSVDIAAPGYRIRSALPNSRSGYLTGTSQATAFVSGVAALLKSQFPSLGAAKLKNVIRSSARKEITLLSKCNSGGRLDATRAYRLASGKKPIPPAPGPRPNNNKIPAGKIKYRYLAN